MKISFAIKIFFLLVLLSACATIKKPYVSVANQSWEESLPPNGVPIAETMYFVSNTGAKDTVLSSTLKLLEQHLTTADENTTITFLGGNTWDGYPNDTLSNSAIQLKNQLSIFQNYQGKVFVMPGFEDWNRGKGDGVEAVERQEDFVQAYLDGKVFVPSDGCGDIVSKKINDNLVMIFIDTQWWLQNWDKEDNINEGCDLQSREEFLESLYAEILDHKNKQLIIAMHHPLFSNGNTGGHFSVRQHLFPLTELNKDLYIPLPIIGSAYPTYRMSGGYRQDISNPLYFEMKEEILEMVKKGLSDFIFISGHEKNMQYFDEMNHHFIISGAASEPSYAKKGGVADFVYQANGFTKLVQYQNGAMWLEFWEAIGDGTQGQVVFRKEIIQAKPKNIYEEPKEVYDELPDSIESKAQPKYSLKKTGKFWLGEQYRDAWDTDVKLPVFDLKKEGLVPIKKGGGFASNSFRLEAADGKQYALRSVDKNVKKVFPEELENVKATNLLQDQISAIHPYGATALPIMADAVVVYHTNPKVVYLKKQEMLGVFNETFDEGWFLFEERPDGDWSDTDDFGSSEEIIGYVDLLAKLRKNEKNQVDQQWVLKSRIFDLFVHDWDRHDDQWRWAEFKEDGLNIYRPIPRDRDQVFYKFRGLLPSLVAVFGMKKFKSFKPDLKDVRGQSFNARNFDHYFLNEMTREDYITAAELMQLQLTDSVIESAFNDWPKEIYDIDALEIIEILKSRRDNLVDIAEDLYQVRNKYVDITGTDRDDFFEVERLENGNTIVKVYHRNKKGKKGEKYFEREFVKGDTKEIVLYGLMGDDEFQLDGESKKGILVRVVGGEDMDNVKDQSKVQGLIKKTRIYDLKGDVEIEEKTSETANKTSNDYKVNEYNRLGFKDNIIFPLADFGTNPDDGFFIGPGVNYTRFRFRKEPFANKQVFKFKVAPKTNAFSIDYEGRFVQVTKRFNGYFNINFKNPEYENYFGLGNHSKNNSSGNDDPYNWVRTKKYHIATMLEKTYNKDAINIRFGMLYESVGAINIKNRIIDNPLENISKSDIKQRHLLGGGLEIAIDEVDDKVRPLSGYRQGFTLDYLNQVGEKDKGLIRFNTWFSNYMTLPIRKMDITLANRVGLEGMQGDYTFIQLPSLGVSQNLRGYRNERFRGETIFYHNIDLRIKLFYWDNVILPFEMGVYGGFDYGRVWHFKGSERKFHTGYTAGLWISPLRFMAITPFLSWSKEEKSQFNLRTKFYF